jgi:hypothetical protein
MTEKPMTRDEWLALSARCEAATGADREIDTDLHEALGGCAHRETEYYCIEDGNDVDSGFTCKRCGVDMYGRRDDVKPVTASLDAIVALIEREFPSAHIGSGRGVAGVFWGLCNSVRIVGAATEPLARCAAFCRAMAEKPS